MIKLASLFLLCLSVQAADINPFHAPHAVRTVARSPKQKAEVVNHTLPRVAAVLTQTYVPLPTETLVWFPVTQQGLSITNYEIWSTADMTIPRQFEASTQATNIAMPMLTPNRFYSVRSVNSFGLKSP